MQIQLHTFRLKRTNTVEPVSVGFLHANTFSFISLHHHRTKTAISTKRGAVLLELLGLNKWIHHIYRFILQNSDNFTAKCQEHPK